MTGTASVSGPDLVFVSPGVQVIADYREPIFYSDNYYWRSDGDIWYRSSSYTSGWVRYQAPVAILRIERPAAYIHYRGTGRVNAGPTGRAHPSPPAHDQRKDMKEAQKAERKEQKAEQKEERREQKAEQKEERKERKEDRQDAKQDRKEQKAERKDDKHDRKDNKHGHK